MRWSTVSLLATTLAGRAFADVPSHRSRKSLNFGPAHPHAVFKSSPYEITTNGFIPNVDGSDPIEVARLFVEDLVASAFRIREDSYTDETTGITHVYFRQLINGLEVTDGDINVNVQDGMVLSYGSSFYNGPVGEEGDIDPHAEYCRDLEASLDGQEPLMALHHSNCRSHKLPQFVAQRAQIPGDVRSAVLQFMMAATPDENLSNDMIERYDNYLERMTVQETHHLLPTPGGPSLVVDNVPDTVNPVKARLAYVQVPKGDSIALSLVWKLEAEMQDNWYEAAVSAYLPHRIISVVDWASDAYAPIPKPKEPLVPFYNVFTWGINDPSEGKRSIVKGSVDVIASPAGWHAIPYANDPSVSSLPKSKEFYHNTTTTWGNNVFAQENWEGRNAYMDNQRPAASDLSFDYEYAPRVTDRSEAQEAAQAYINATVTQLFYTCNMFHDMFYRYGFTEATGNFQQYNFERGGAEDDAVIANAQDGSGYNNANFMTPPDGQNGRMRMYLWNTALPYRDGDFEAGIVIHEFSHGLSTRLTGGPLNSGCLGYGESGGMGEGWGDFIATMIRSTSKYSDYPMGAWAANTEGGIRNYPYSMDETINPSTYKTLDKPGYWGVHAIGEVWAEMLWVVAQHLIAVHGFSDTVYPPLALEDGTIPEGDFYRPRVGKKPLVPKHGNTLAIQLVVNGMKLQPCRPSFFDSRDAIIAADQSLTGGENFCTLWKAFAERGMGPDARVDGRTPWGGGIRANDFSVPVVCSTP
ncbi:hypothetical protein FISHEDRAFT_65088 [Fistulina hepatica ATCC 64428]|uniref:Extracellular metalloproteinase n=1 Tax=Fistulina hepatica ATCC 64428 TaxID=1128425 RepID=A0A0D7AH11_9AGAR|nr:hypothetical protein FISHEDRAFT_65088 [Fistulina hepatica ATCC 64428]